MLTTKLTINLRCLASQFVNINGLTRSSHRSVSSKEANTNEGALHLIDIAEEENEAKAAEEAIERKRNKSELFPADYNRQHDRPPYEQPQAEFHQSLKYRRRLYGKYGETSNVDPSILWPDKKELAAMREFEEVTQPFTLQQLIQKNNEKNALAEEKLRKAEAEVLQKVSRVNDEIIAFHKKIAAEKAKAQEILDKKNKLIDQVRQHFGYKLDVRDEKFKEMLEKLQKEEKKKAKAEKKAKQEAKKQKTVLQSATEHKESKEEVEAN